MLRMGTARDGPAGPAGFKDNCPASTVRVKGSANARLYEHEEVLRSPKPPHDIISERFYWMQIGHIASWTWDTRPPSPPSKIRPKNRTEASPLKVPTDFPK